MSRRELVAVWLLALGLRLLQVAFEPAYLHPDALYQGLEPAFRAVYGHGIVSWEFEQGLRSWTWPGLLAAPFAALRWLGIGGPGQGMGWSVALARLVPLLLDLLCLQLAVGLVRRHAGALAERVVAWVGASHPAWVIMAAQPLIDVPAATLLLALISLAESSAAANRLDLRGLRRGAATAIGLGALAATTALLRVQLAPAVVALGALWAARHRRALRSTPLPTLGLPALGLVVVAALWGALDWLTWGAPWHTVRAYLAYNLGRGQTAFGVMAADAYWVQFGNALPWLRWLSLPLVVLGARRAPWLAVALLAVVLPHQWVAYRVWRFLHPALWPWLCLVAIGVDALQTEARAWQARRAGDGPRPAASRATTRALATVLACVLVSGLAWLDGGVWRTTWLYHQGGDEAVRRSRGLNRAALAASSLPHVRRVVQAALPEAAAPGHALLGHDATVLHALGRRLDRSTLRDRDTWFVVDSPAGRTHPTRPRIARDWDSGVALFQLPEVLERNLHDERARRASAGREAPSSGPKKRAPSATPVD